MMSRVIEYWVRGLAFHTWAWRYIASPLMERVASPVPNLYAVGVFTTTGLSWSTKKLRQGGTHAGVVERHVAVIVVL